ncbi:MAG: hypothetical protein AB1716_02655 [Planctomycetota bacterium]
MRLPAVLRDLLALPTAPFLEHAVLDHLQQACARLPGVALCRDPHGDLLAHYRHAQPANPPVAFVAHTDHPGFEALEMVDRRILRAAFRGGVKPEYFPRARVRFWTAGLWPASASGAPAAGRWVSGEVQELSKTQRERTVTGWVMRPQEVRVRVRQPVDAGAPGMWDLPDPQLDGDLVLARACDDLAGCAALLALLQRLSRAQAAAEVYCLFTRAEEVGFVGAIAAARAATVPRDVPIFSIETSSALVNATIGSGPIVRVGDRTAVFSERLSGFVDRVAHGLAARRRRFRYQRKLMDGGSCEAVPFLAYGYEAGGICLALGNYHNMDVRRQRIGSESVSLSDWSGMVDLFEALAVADDQRSTNWEETRTRLDERFAQYEPLLNRGTAGVSDRTAGVPARCPASA